MGAAFGDARPRAPIFPFERRLGSGIISSDGEPKTDPSDRRAGRPAGASSRAPVRGRHLALWHSQLGKRFLPGFRGRRAPRSSHRRGGQDRGLEGHRRRGGAARHHRANDRSVSADPGLGGGQPERRLRPGHRGVRIPERLPGRLSHQGQPEARRGGKDHRGRAALRLRPGRDRSRSSWPLWPPTSPPTASSPATATRTRPSCGWP